METTSGTEDPSHSRIASLYDDKSASYYGNARHDIVARMQTDATSQVLELGCGSGGTGRAVLGAGKAGRYVGIELSATAAAVAARDLSEVLIGDVHEMDLTPLQGQFDALIVSEVLEHLLDPWDCLARLVGCLKSGGMIYASSPNLSHWTVLRSLLGGRFDYADAGFMDRTHLRWFTPATYRELFEGAGVEIVEIGALVPLRPKARLIDALTGGRLRHLFVGQITVVGRRP